MSDVNEKVLWAMTVPPKQVGLQYLRQQGLIKDRP